MLTVFYGEDTYRSRDAYRAAREEVLRRTGVPVIVLRDEQLTPAAFQTALQSPTLFGVRPALAVERLTRFTGAQASAVADALATIPKQQVVLVWEEGIPAAHGIVWRALQQHATPTAFPLLGETETAQWVERRVRDAGRALDGAARQELLARCGGNLWLLAAELDKLFLFAVAERMTVADVREVVPSNPAVDTFTVIRALVRGRRETALRLLTIAARAGDEPRRIVFWAIRELGALLRVREILDRGQRVTAWDLVRELRMPKTAAEALLETARQTTTPALRALFDRGVVAYYHLNTGRAEAEEILERLAFEQSTHFSPSA